MKTTISEVVITIKNVKIVCFYRVVFSGVKNV